MQKKYYWRHEDTGRVCETCVNVRPSRRWHKISKKDFTNHERPNKMYTERIAIVFVDAGSNNPFPPSVSEGSITLTAFRR
jgi:hypothetical protein